MLRKNSPRRVTITNTPKEIARERYIRWQNLRISQFTYTLNLFLSFSVAALGFGVTLLTNKDFSPSFGGKLLFIGGLGLIFLAIIVGIFCTINRMLDIRKTTDLSYAKYKSKSKAIIEQKRKEVKSLGRFTWTLFWSHLALFGFGVVLLFLSLITYYTPLFFSI